MVLHKLSRIVLRREENWTQKKRKESAIIATTALWGRCVNARKWKNKFKRCVCAVRARQRRSDISNFFRTPRGLCACAIDLSFLRICALLEPGNGALVALLQTLRRCHGDKPFRFFYCVFIKMQNHGSYFVFAQSVCDLGDPTSTNEDAAALCEMYDLLLLAVWRFAFFKERSRIALRMQPV